MALIREAHGAFLSRLALACLLWGSLSPILLFAKILYTFASLVRENRRSFFEILKLFK
jgi:hypothetical protein|nr:MAG TPA: hypothetical protein [Caudoviricetes sp.]